MVSKRSGFKRISSVYPGIENYSDGQPQLLHKWTAVLLPCVLGMFDAATQSSDYHNTLGPAGTDGNDTSF
jgi:hypothetical protein